MDVPWENIKKYFIESVLFIKKALENGGSVFVHWKVSLDYFLYKFIIFSWDGISRSPSCICAYLIFYHNFKTNQAI